MDNPLLHVWTHLLDVQSQSKIDLGLNMDKVHYFDSETEKRIVL